MSVVLDQRGQTTRTEASESQCAVGQAESDDQRNA